MHVRLSFECLNRYIKKHKVEDETFKDNEMIASIHRFADYIAVIAKII